MNAIHSAPTVLVTLREATVGMLMALRNDDETLDDVTARCADFVRHTPPTIGTPARALVPVSQAVISHPVVSAKSTWPTTISGVYTASVLEAPVRADTLGALLRNVVDVIHELDPSCIERLSLMKARTRRYVARARDQVHDGRRDLLVLKTISGWWVSGNIGKPDLVRSLRAICRASDLLYGDDIRFPG